MSEKNETARTPWPELKLSEWKPTLDTLHMWTQIVGKIRLRLSPPINHWWHTALYVTPRGLVTSPIPYGFHSFEIRFDFFDHLLAIETNDGRRREMALAPKTVASFYGELMEMMVSLGMPVKIGVVPQELPVPVPIPFPLDRVHASYDRDAVGRFFQMLVQADRLMKVFRSDFVGKCSPVHFFWGSFDHAYSRFSGRRAPERPGADLITREGYSHEVMSVGFWPGSGNVEDAAFYAYMAPEPEGFSSTDLKPAYYNPATRGFVLMLDEVRRSENPDQRVLDFFEGAYESAANLGNWDRENLEGPRVSDSLSLPRTG